MSLNISDASFDDDYVHGSKVVYHVEGSYKHRGVGLQDKKGALERTSTRRSNRYVDTGHRLLRGCKQIDLGTGSMEVAGPWRI